MTQIKFLVCMRNDAQFRNKGLKVHGVFLFLLVRDEIRIVINRSLDTAESFKETTTRVNMWIRYMKVNEEQVITLRMTEHCFHLLILLAEDEA